MKKKWLLFAALVVISGLLAFALTRYYASRPTVSAGDTQISLLSDRAQPDAVAIERGKAVVFNTKDNKIHNIGQGSGKDKSAPQNGAQNKEQSQAPSGSHEHTAGGKESGPFGKGQAYRVVFDKVGTYDFHDHLNPKIQITVVVYEPDKR